MNQNIKILMNGHSRIMTLEGAKTASDIESMFKQEKKLWKKLLRKLDILIALIKECKNGKEKIT